MTLNRIPYRVALSALVAVALAVALAAAGLGRAAAQPGGAAGTSYFLPSVQNGAGIQTLLFHMRQTTGNIGTLMWFDFKVVNTTASPITYGILAAHTDQGVTADSWHDPLLPGKVLNWTDYIEFGSTGTYQVYLGICYASHDACKTDGAPWTRLSDDVTVNIVP
jgi:hypothetical protein